MSTGPDPARAEPPSADATPSTPRLSPARALATLLSAVLAAVVLLVVLPRLLGVPLADIVATIGEAPVLLVVGIVILGAAAVLADAIGLHAALPGMRFPVALRTGTVTQALTLAIPGGSLFTLPVIHTAARRSGLTAAAAVTGVIVCSVVDLALATAIPLLGALAAAVAGLGSGAWRGTFGVVGVVGLLAGLAAVFVLLHRPTLQRLIAGAQDGLQLVLGMLGRDDGTDLGRTVLARRDEAVALLRRRGPVLVGGPVIGRVLQFAVLLLALHAVGISLSLLAAVAVFTLGRAAALLPLTPGGAGITETAAAAALVALGAPAASAAAAAVLTMLGLVIVPVLAAVPALALGGARAR